MHNTPRSHTSRRIPARIAMVLLALDGLRDRVVVRERAGAGRILAPVHRTDHRRSDWAQRRTGSLLEGIRWLAVDPLSGNVYVARWRRVRR